MTSDDDFVYLSNKQFAFKTYHEISIDLFEYLKALQQSLNYLNAIYLKLDYDVNPFDDYVDTDIYKQDNFFLTEKQVKNFLDEIEQINAEINAVNALLSLIRSRKFLTDCDLTNPY